MSADTRPISPTHFAAALKDLSIGMLHLKVLEIRNSIAHLQYSNDQLKPFAEGTAVALNGSPSSNTNNDDDATAPDQDCIDAIRENEQVIERMAERLALIRTEVEDRGVSWTEFQSKDEIAADKQDDKEINGEATSGRTVNEEEGQGEQPRHSAWSDGTFQTGTIRDGQIHLDSQPGRPNGGGGSLNDEQLRAALEERLRNLGTDDDDQDEGLHL